MLFIVIYLLLDSANELKKILNLRVIWTEFKKVFFVTSFLQEYTNSAEEMRQNLLQIYHKLGKSFDVGDIATRFSYVNLIISMDLIKCWKLNKNIIDFF